MQTEACEVSVTSVRDFRHRASVSLEPSGEDSGSFPFIPELHGEYSVGIYPQGARWPERPVEELSFYVTDPHLAGCIKCQETGQATKIISQPSGDPS